MIIDKIILGLLLIFSVSIAANAQYIELNTRDRCMSHYFTEQQGIEFLAVQYKSYKNLAGWEKRAALVKENILMGARLKGIKLNAPMNAVVHSKKVFEGYTVENVFFESMPGFYVTGNIYKPTANLASYAGVLCPHGHWDNARLDTAMQLLCASLARMGAIVFTYDMIGYGESTQCQHNFPHSQNAAIQTLTSIRSLDFLLTQPEIDKKRIGITGASGGGTQTFLLSAIDKRVSAAAPVVMVGATFFGGCTCESGMPIHRNSEKNYQTCNAEIAGLIAPRPLLLVSVGDDWTYKTPEIEYPFLKSIYTFYNKPGNVSNAHFANETHDFGFSKRKSVYNFFSKSFSLNIRNIQNSKGEINEDFVNILKQEQLHVFTDKYKRPANAVIGNEEVTNVFNNLKRN